MNFRVIPLLTYTGQYNVCPPFAAITALAIFKMLSAMLQEHWIVLQSVWGHTLELVEKVQLTVSKVSEKCSTKFWSGLGAGQSSELKNSKQFLVLNSAETPSPERD